MGESPDISKEEKAVISETSLIFKYELSSIVEKVRMMSKFAAKDGGDENWPIFTGEDQYNHEKLIMHQPVSSLSQATDSDLGLQYATFNPES